MTIQAGITKVFGADNDGYWLMNNQRILPSELKLLDELGVVEWVLISSVVRPYYAGYILQYKKLKDSE